LASADDVQGDDLAALGIGDVGVAAVWMSGRVARLAETVQHVRDPQRAALHDRDRPDFRVGDDRHTSDRLDAAGLAQGLHVATDPTAGQVDSDEPRFFVRSDERHLLAGVEARQPPRRQHE